MMFQVSVVIPTYGKHSTALSAITRAWLAQDVSCEVVIAYTGDPPPLAPHPHVILARADLTTPAPGLLRNHGAAVARAPTLYLSDADVAPLDPTFLRKALKLTQEEPLCQPWMYRLLGGAQALEHVSQNAAPAGESCFVTVTPSGYLVPVKDDRVVWRGRRESTPEGPWPYAAVPTSIAPAGERRSVRAAFHWGGVLLPQPTFAAVGGYCTRYQGWGCEDDDLLLKLSSISAVRRAWHEDPALSCTHVEHDYAHVGSPEHEDNVHLFRARVQQGPEAMIAEDTTKAV